MKSILIVDDNVEFLKLLSSILKKQRFQTYEATGVQEALKMLRNITFDAICSDFNMSDGTGLDLLEELRKQNTKTPFMLMSASDDTYLEDKALSLEASFCCKTDYDLISKIKAMT